MPPRAFFNGVRDTSRKYGQILINPRGKVASFFPVLDVFLLQRHQKNEPTLFLLVTQSSPSVAELRFIL